MRGDDLIDRAVQIALAVILVSIMLFARAAFSEEPEAAPACVCVAGRPAIEINRLRIEVRLLKAAALVNRKIDAKAKRTAEAAQ